MPGLAPLRNPARFAQLTIEGPIGVLWWGDGIELSPLSVYLALRGLRFEEWSRKS